MVIRMGEAEAEKGLGFNASHRSLYSYVLWFPFTRNAYTYILRSRSSRKG